MKVNILIFVALALVCLYSCDNQKRQEKLISNNQTKYWDVIAPRINERASIRGYCFNNNGKYKYFLYYKNKRYADEAIDIVLDRSWCCLNDSCLILGKSKTHILKLTKDSFVYQFDDKSIVRLAVSKNQTDTINPPLRTKINVIWDTIHVTR
jgi:hypothetical protein